eukprot:369605_1
MAQQTEGNDEKKSLEHDSYKLVFREANDSLYLMMTERKLKRSFHNTFSKSTLNDMELKQSIAQICNLFNTALSGKRSEIKLKIRFGNAENNKKMSSDQLSKLYSKGCVLYIFICIEESWFTAEYSFKLLEKKRNEMDILQDIVTDMEQEIDMLKKQLMKQPLRVSFNGKSNVINKECEIFNSYGISKVIRESQGKYVVYFDKKLDNNKYIVNLTANMWYTGGVIIGLEGNNRKGDQGYTQTEERFIIGTRCPRANASRDCDLIHVVVYQ